MPTLGAHGLNCTMYVRMCNCMQGATWANPPARARGTLEFDRNRRARAHRNAARASVQHRDRRATWQHLYAVLATANKRQDTCVAFVLCA
eukprot:5592391-Pleurochrysis_carterae.AAC.1